MAVILYNGNSASYPDVPLSFDEKVRAKEGGKETKGEMYPSLGPLRFITSHSLFSLAIIIYTLLFLLFLLLSSGYPDVEPPVRRLRLER